jgi:ferric-dicitrate binding protein FerR (iron transport regulator)
VSAQPAAHDPWQPARREIAAAVAVVAALAAVAAFALWGMRPAGNAPAADTRAPAVTAPAAPHEREGGERGD